MRARIAAACAAAGRDPAEVTLVAVTKTYPASDVVRLAGLGVTDVGENRDQEAAPKAAEVAAAGAHVRWHFVGQLQRNKCRSVVRYADVVHSVDSVRLAAALAAAAAAGTRDRAARRAGAGEPRRRRRRGGAVAGRRRSGPRPAARWPRRSPARARCGWRRDGGGAAGLGAGAGLRQAGRGAPRLFRADHPDATVISAGMSGDLEEAIAHGATHVRIGSALLGKRHPLR